MFGLRRGPRRRLGSDKTIFWRRLSRNALGRDAPGGTSAIALDTTVLTAAGGACFLIAVLLSFVPLLTPWQDRLAGTLRGGGRDGTDSPSMRWVRSSLIALVGCTLMIRSVVNLVRTDLGIQTAHVVRARIALPTRSYRDEVMFLRFYDRLVERMPVGSTQFALTNLIPLYETPRQPMEVDSAHGASPTAGVLAVSEGYFAMFGIKFKKVAASQRRIERDRSPWR